MSEDILTNTDNVGEQTAFAGLNTINIDPTKSVLKYRVGDAITLSGADFIRFSSAFFAEIEIKYL